jgi:hypothetical protein
MNPIPVHLAVEDELSEHVLRKLLIDTDREYAVGSVFGGRGFGYLRSRANNFNAAAAAGTPILLLTDLDQHGCAPEIIQDWLTMQPHANLIFRVAVREVESWLLADRVGFADFLQVSDDLIPQEPDDIADPKQTLIDVARRSRIRSLRDALVPRDGSTATQGPDYNSCLIGFVRDHWNRNAAVERSPSLQRTWERLLILQPTWSEQS